MNLKPSNDFRRAFSFWQPATQRKPALRRRDQRHALLQRARDEKNIPHVRVKVAHEFFDAFARRTVAVAERVRHGGLQIFSQHVERADDFVMQFRPHAQQKIIGGLKLLALGVADKFLLLQFAQRARAVFEKRHPQQILKIAQAAAAVFDVRFLHAGGVAVFRAPRCLVFQPQRQCIFPRTRRRIWPRAFFEICSNNFSSPAISRASMSDVLDCMSVLATFTQSSMLRTAWPTFRPMSQSGYKMPSINLDRYGSGLLRRDLAVVQKHEINVAVRIQLRAAITADGDERERRKFLLRLRRQTRARLCPKMPQQCIEDRRARPADFALRPRPRDARSSAGAFRP